MENRNLDDLAVFIELAQAKDVQAASALLEAEPVQAALTRLVRRFDCQLIKRTGVLTSAGERLLHETLASMTALQDLVDGGGNAHGPQRTTPLREAPNLHDATLLEIVCVWESGDVVVRVRAGGGLVIIKGRDTRSVDWSRTQPWGPSVSINEVRLAHTDSSSRLELEMQSGDTLVVEARRFEIACDVQLRREIHAGA